MTEKMAAGKGKAVKPERLPTIQERKAAEAYSQRLEEGGQLPRLVLEGDGEPYTLTTDHEDPALGILMIMEEALGSPDLAFGDGVRSQLVNLSSEGRNLNERTLNFLLTAIKDIKPKDAVETMLATQMAAAHLATLTFARRLALVENIPQQDKAFNKLARTFTAQVEALKRYRTGGEQKVTVQHVNVNDGGQAVVGNVTAEAKTGRG